MADLNKYEEAESIAARSEAAIRLLPEDRKEIIEALKMNEAIKRKLQSLLNK